MWHLNARFTSCNQVNSKLLREVSAVNAERNHDYSRTWSSVWSNSSRSLWFTAVCIYWHWQDTIYSTIRIVSYTECTRHESYDMGMFSVDIAEWSQLLTWSDKKQSHYLGLCSNNLTVEAHGHITTLSMSSIFSTKDRNGSGPLTSGKPLPKTTLRKAFLISKNGIHSCPWLEMYSSCSER